MPLEINTDLRCAAVLSSMLPVLTPCVFRLTKMHPCVVLPPTSSSPTVRHPTTLLKQPWWLTCAIEVREDLKPLNLSFTEIAKRVGERWQVLSPGDKEPYETQAAIAKERFTAEIAEYKKTDNSREYLEYLAEFKARNNPSNAGKYCPLSCWFPRASTLTLVGFKVQLRPPMASDSGSRQK